MRTGKDNLFRACYSKGVAIVICFLAETQRHAEWESLIVGIREGFRCALTGGCWLGEAVCRPARSGAPYGIDKHSCLPFSDWSYVSSGNRNQGSCQLLIKFWPLWADHQRDYCLASWTSDSEQSDSLKYDLQIASQLPGLVLFIMGQFPGLVAAAGSGSEFYL